MKHPRLRLSGHVTNWRWGRLSLLTALAAVLQLGAAVGMGYLAGFGAIHAVLDRFDSPWLIAIAGSLAISFVGYYFVYRELYFVDDGPGLGARQMRAVVAAGFGGFLAHGGAALDEFALKGAGAGEREAKVRVAALGGLEHGILALGTSAAAIAVTVAGYAAPPPDFALPWSILPVPGFCLAFWLAGRHADRYRHAEGWRYKLGIFIDSICLIRQMFRKPLKHWKALGGMALFWAADFTAAWAGLATFGFRMNSAQFIVGLATGMVFSRRTGPLGGAGVLMVVLPLTVWDSGAPLAVAVAGIFVYRVLALWLPMPFAFAGLSTLREVGKERKPQAEGQAESPPAEPALSEESA